MFVWKSYGNFTVLWKNRPCFWAEASKGKDFKDRRWKMGRNVYNKTPDNWIKSNYVFFSLIIHFNVIPYKSRVRTMTAEKDVGKWEFYFNPKESVHLAPSHSSRISYICSQDMQGACSHESSLKFSQLGGCLEPSRSRGCLEPSRSKVFTFQPGKKKT